MPLDGARPVGYGAGVTGRGGLFQGNILVGVKVVSFASGILL